MTAIAGGVLRVQFYWLYSLLGWDDFVKEGVADADHSVAKERTRASEEERAASKG